MKANIQKLSRARNAKDATMNIAKPVILSAAKNLFSSSSHGQRQDPSLTTLRMTGTVHALAAIALLLAMPAAHAQVDPDCTGTNPGTVSCNGPLDTPAGPAIYADGVTHNATTGDLTVNVGNGVTSFGTGGFATTATGDNNITMTKGSGSMVTAVATGTRSPAVISAITQDGDIHVTAAGSGVGNIQGVGTLSQYGVYAQSTGLGNIDLNISQRVTQAETATAAAIAAIHAQSNGGNIHITADFPGSSSSVAGITGRQYGIRAIAAGAGNIVIDANTVVRHSNTAGVGIAAIQAIADTGSITLNLNSNVANGQIISLQAEGLMTLNLGASIGSSTAADSRSPIHMSGSGAGVVNLIGASSGFGTLYGGIDARDNTGGITVNVEPLSGGWSLYGNSLMLGSGDDHINNRGLMLVSNNFVVANARFVLETQVEMGAGDDALLNEGTMVIGARSFSFTQNRGLEEVFLGRYGTSAGDRETMPAQATFDSLERFENRGLIVMGALVYGGGTGGFRPEDLAEIGDFGQRFYPGDAAGEAFCRRVLGRFGLPNPPANGYTCLDSPVRTDTDLIPGSVLSLPGTAFVGGPGSRILMDAYFGEGIAQTDCGGTREVTYPHRMPGADCLDLPGGSTSGSTALIVRDGRPWDQGAYNPDGIVVVDVSGGTSAAGHFTLSPESDHYRESANGLGLIDKGLFVFPLIYDESTQQHKLVGIPGTSALQLPLMTHAAQAIGRQTLGVGLDGRVRGWQSALRSGSTLRGGFWGGLQQDQAERDVIQPRAVLGETLAFNNDFEQDTSTMMLGGDFIVPAEGKTAWVMGGSIGYARSQLGFDDSGNDAELEGVVLGVHGGYQTERWYLNAAYGQSFLQVDHYAETYSLSTAGSVAGNKAGTQGLRFDGGLRLALADNLHVEPLATLAWIRADFDDLVIASPNNPLATGNTAKFGNAVSLRGALGARIGFDHALSSLRIGYALTGRYWNEFDGETGVRIESLGSEAALSDTFDGSFLDLAGRISVSDAEGHISGYVDATSASGDDYSSLGFSAGFRYQW